MMLMLLACAGGTDDPAKEDAITVPEAPAIRVEVATLAPSIARLEVRLPGEVEGSRDATLASAMGGFIEDVLVVSGDSVEKGTPLVMVDSSTYRAQLVQAKARAELASSELERVKKLGDLATPQQLQNAQVQATISKAEADLARIRAGRATIRAPFDGVVGLVDLEQGEVVSPSSPMIRFMQLDPAVVSLAVADRDVVAMHTGMEALVTTNAQPNPVVGTIVSISPMADMESRSFEVKVAIPNPMWSFLPGMIASVSIAEEVAEGAIVIPQDWVVTRLSGVGVFVEQEGAAQWRPIELGNIVRDQVVVASGLSEGDRVVIKGHRDIAEGDKLLLAREGRCCENGTVVF